MTFLLGWPLLLTGMLAAGIPVVIHLLHRQRTTSIKWGAMQFLLESPMQTKRRKRVDQWLLLALRVLVLVLLAWLLARPLISSEVSGAMGANAPTDVAAVVDHSLSMGRNVGDHTLADEAAGVVDSAAAALRAGDTLSIILAEHRPRALTPLPVGSRQTAPLLQSLHQLKPGLTDCSIPEAVQSARELLSHGKNSRKLVLIVSDQQKSNWSIGDVTSWRAALGAARQPGEPVAEVRSVALQAPHIGADISIGGITIEPHLVGMNQATQILAAVTNHGPKDVAAVTIHLAVDGHESATPAQIPSLGDGQTTTLRFDHTFTTPGSHWVKVWTDGMDALPADNNAVAAIYVWQRLPVLIIDGQLTGVGGFRSAQFLQAAMQPVELRSNQATLIQPTIISAAESPSVKLDEYFAIILNDVARLPPEVEEKLADYAAEGHGVWVILGSRTTADFITTSLGMDRARLARLSLKNRSPRSENNPQPIDIRSAANPMIAMIASSERNALAGAVMTRWWSITPQDGDDQMVLATADGDPLVFEHPIGSAGGRVVVWCTSADGSWNNWTVMPNFVPLVNETIHHLASPQTRAWSNGNVAAGAAISWSGPASPAVQSVDVMLPDGSVDRGRPATFRNGRWEFQYPNTFIPGRYQLRFAPSQVPQPVYFGVAIDPRELEPATLSEQDMRWLADNRLVRPIPADQVAALITHQAGGAELWKWLAILVIASLVAETFLTYRMAGLRKNVTLPASQLSRAAA